MTSVTTYFKCVLAEIKGTMSDLEIQVEATCCGFVDKEACACVQVLKVTAAGGEGREKGDGVL